MATDNGVHFWSSTGAGSGGGGGSGDVPAHMKADQATIGSAASSIAVTFTSAFAAAPVVVAWLTCSDSNPPILSIQGNFPTTTGFTAVFSAPTPTANYVLNWIAASVYDS